MKKPKTSIFRVYIGQINQTYVDVRAADKYSAVEKAYGKWKREFAQPTVTYVDRPSDPTDADCEHSAYTLVCRDCGQQHPAVGDIHTTATVSAVRDAKE